MIEDREKICSCGSRAIRKDERVEYVVPKEGKLIGYVFAKDCPVHGYTVNTESEVS